MGRSAHNLHVDKHPVIPMKIITRSVLAAAVLTAGLCLDIQVGRASGNAPWCAVMNAGNSSVIWDCQYRTLEECVPNVLAGNRGFCNENPTGPGIYARSADERRKSRKRH